MKDDRPAASLREKEESTNLSKPKKQKEKKQKKNPIALVKNILIAALCGYTLLNLEEIEENGIFSAYDKQIAPPTLASTSHSRTEDTWIVIVSTSRFWQNYRHTTNALAMYWAAKRSGVPDDHIVLMVAEKHACDARNVYPGTAFADKDLSVSLFCSGVEIDYVGDSVTAVNFLRVLTGNVPAGTPKHQQIFPTKNSNVVVYMTGHSGDNFMKFHDYEFISSYDMAQAFWRMHRKDRYHRLLFIVDTCQAATLYDQVDAPNVVSIGSSIKKEDSLSSFRRYAEELGAFNVDGFSGEFFWKFAEFGADAQEEKNRQQNVLGDSNSNSNSNTSEEWRLWGEPSHRRHTQVVDLTVTTAAPPEDYTFVDMMHEDFFTKSAMGSTLHCSHYDKETRKMTEGSNLNLREFKKGWRLRDFFGPPVVREEQP